MVNGSKTSRQIEITLCRFKLQPGENESNIVTKNIQIIFQKLYNELIFAAFLFRCLRGAPWFYQFGSVYKDY